MKLFLVASLSICLFASSYQAEDIYKACHGKFEAGPNICDKFNFISSQEVRSFQIKYIKKKAKFCFKIGC